MTATLESLVGFVLWTLVLVFTYVLMRGVLVLKGQRAANDFPADRPHEGSALYHRLMRAHLNCLENLPLYASVTLTAAVLGITGLTDPYAWWYLGLRVAQSTTHIVSTSAVAVTIRATFLLGQYIVLGIMISKILV